MANRTRPNQILFFVSDDEKRIIKAKMAQLGTKNMGAYLRKMAIDGYIIKVDYTQQKKLAAAEKGSEELSGVKKALEAEQGKTADLERRLDVSRRAADDAQNSVSVLEKDIAALKSENEELSALREKAGMYEELTVKFSQIESENAALRAGAGSNASEGAAPAQMEELKKQLSDALAEVKELRKINASLNRQLNEMLEDGQLTL